MATAHVWPFGTVKSTHHYDSDDGVAGHYALSPVTAPGAATTDCKTATTVTPGPCVGHVAYSPDYESGRPGDYLDERHEFWPLPRADRYPPPATAELVTLWKKDRRVVMSVTAGGQTQDFYMPPARLVYLLREVAEQLAENTLIQ